MPIRFRKPHFPHDRPGVYATRDASDRVTLVQRCARGYWFARPLKREGADRRVSWGLTRVEAVRRYRAGEYDGPCPGCSCERVRQEPIQS